MVYIIQGLIQKEKVDIDGEKSVQIRIVAKSNFVAKKIVTQGWLQVMIMMIMEPKQAMHYYVIIMFILCYWYDQKRVILFTGS